MSVAQIGPIYVPESAPPPAVNPSLQMLSAVPLRPVFAGFWLRAVAFAIDTIFLFSIFVLGASFFPNTLAKLVPANPPSLTSMPQPSLLLVAVFALLGCAYYTLFEASPWQATPGKRMLRLYVTDLGGQRLSIGRALMRNLARQISGFFLIGYVITGFTEKKQALHDILAGCLVLRRPR